jgi:hypothetical protein
VVAVADVVLLLTPTVAAVVAVPAVLFLIPLS